MAWAIRDELRVRGIAASAAPFGAVDAGTVAAADAFVVGSWVAGKIVAGVGPPPAALAGIDALPPLEGRPTAVYCTYDVSPRHTLDVMAARLRARGAHVDVGGTFRNGPLPRIRRRSLSSVPGFVEDLVASLERPIAPTV